MSEPKKSAASDSVPAEMSADGYRVLARKYRPASFDDLIGQDAMVRTISNAFESGRIPQAWILTGVRGVGKTTSARILARALNYELPDGSVKEPTINMPVMGVHCQSIIESRHPDVLEMDAASHNSVEDVRQINDAIRYAPMSARYKVYILDEVHMLSTSAFNALLKTLEEPPPHVKFIFATTEIRKVPVTILSRCQRFDLRRIESAQLIDLLAAIAEKEKIAITKDALALIARAAEGSARDGLSLLDQAIAHGETSEIGADMVRDMLGLADRGRVLDLFEKVMAGKIADALTDLGNLYDHGADPLAVMQDLLEIVHFLTRIKVAPGAEGFFDGSSSEAKRAADMAAKLSVPSLTRAWQMLLKGLIEVRDATQPSQACEMALIRLAYAADLPPTDKLVRGLLDGDATPKPATARPAPSPAGSGTVRAQVSRSSEGTAAWVKAEPTLSATPQVLIRSLEDIAALAQANGAPVLKVHIENGIHLVQLEHGKIEFRPSARAPRTLAGDLSQKLKDWTGIRWSVSIAREGGAPTLAEQRKSAKAAKFESATQEPMVREILDRFPGAEIIAVRNIADEDDIVASMPDDDS